MAKLDINAMAEEYKTSKSPKVLSDLYLTLYQYCHRIVFKYVRTEFSADIAIQAVHNCINSLETHDSTVTKFTTWAWFVARNEALTHLKTRKALVSSDEIEKAERKFTSLSVSPEEFEFPELDTILLSELDISSILDEIEVVNPSAIKYIKALKSYNKYGDLKAHAQAEGVKINTMRTRIFNGRKYVKSYILQKYSEKRIINDLI